MAAVLCGTFLGCHFILPSIPSKYRGHYVQLPAYEIEGPAVSQRPVELSELVLSLVRMWSRIKGKQLFLECAGNGHGLCVTQPRDLSTLGHWVNSSVRCLGAGTHQTKPGLSPSPTLRSADFGQVTHSLCACFLTCKMGESHFLPHSG